MKFYRSGRDAMARLGLAAPEEMAEVEARFPVYVNEYYLGLIDPADWKNDPIARQVLPDEAELVDQSSSFDPLAEEEQMPVPRLIHRFDDRVVLLVTGHCAVRCRFCFRRPVPAWICSATTGSAETGSPKRFARCLRNDSFFRGFHPVWRAPEDPFRTSSRFPIKKKKKRFWPPIDLATKMCYNVIVGTSMGTMS